MNQFVAFKGNFKDADTELAADKEFDGDYVPREIRDFVLEGFKSKGFTCDVKNEKPVLRFQCPLGVRSWDVSVGLMADSKGVPVWSIDVQRDIKLMERLSGSLDPLEASPLVDAIQDLLKNDPRVHGIHWYKNLENSPVNDPFDGEIHSANTPRDEVSPFSLPLIERLTRLTDGYGSILPYAIVVCIGLAFISVKLAALVFITVIFGWPCMMGLLIVVVCSARVKDSLQNPKKGDYTVAVCSIFAVLGAAMAAMPVFLIVRIFLGICKNWK